MSQAQEISNLFAGRLASIREADGYLTDIGVRVYRGRRRLDPDLIPCVVLIEGEDNVLAQTFSVRQKEAKLGQRYIFEGHTACDPDNPNDAAHDILADLKRAIFGGDQYDARQIRALRYIGRTIQPREDGTELVAASIEIEIEFVETLDNP